MAEAVVPRTAHEAHRLVLQVVHPALPGRRDGPVSTRASLVATAAHTGRPHQAFVVGRAASVGAALSTGLATALSDDGKVSGRESPIARGTVTGGIGPGTMGAGA